MDVHHLAPIYRWTLRVTTLLLLVAVACFIVFLESHVYRGPSAQGLMIVDLGFEATREVHEILRSHLFLHHCLAFLNTVGLCTLVLYTIFRIGYWERQPGMVIVQIGIFAVRLFCGCTTQLPYSAEYFASAFDLPDFADNIFHMVMPNDFRVLINQRHSHFFSFFSGHVALVNLLAVHFYRRGRIGHSLFCHLLNGLQIMRFLATRGHYSIDIIGGIVVGRHAHTYVSSLDSYLISNTFVKHVVRSKQSRFTS